MQEFDKIYLVWRKGQGFNRVAVGEIFLQDANYVFKYLPNAKEMLNEGFAAYTEFRDLDKTYKQNVLEIFGQRLTKSSRPDIKNLYRFWGVDETKSADIFYLLGKTQAQLATDNFELIPEYNIGIPLTFVSEIVGLTHNPLAKGTLLVGDILDIVKDNSNQFDINAIKTYKHKKFIGFIKAIHCNVISNTDLRKIKVVVNAIDQNGIVKRIFVKVIIS